MEVTLGVDLGQGEVGVTRDAGEDVVEVMGDAAGELPDRLHLRSLSELPLEPSPVAGVADHGDDVGAGLGIDVAHADLGGECRVVAASVRGVSDDASLLPQMGDRVHPREVGGELVLQVDEPELQELLTTPPQGHRSLLVAVKQLPGSGVGNEDGIE